MANNQNILDMEYSVLHKIQNILENPVTMRSFLEILPPDCTCEDVLISMEIESQKYNMTPAKILLRFLGNKGYTVSDLIRWFQAIGLERALMLLRSEEALVITTHPQKEVRINQGCELLLTCNAVSYPLPEYQWYKDDKEILLQIDPVLSIKSVRPEDSGTYTCLVTKWDSRRNTYDWLYSDFSNVTVIPAELHAIPSSNQGSQPSTPNFGSSCNKVVPELSVCSEPLKFQDLTTEIVSPLKLFRQEKEVSLLQGNNSILPPKRAHNLETPESPKKDDITITKHPYINGKIAQGMSLCLICEGVSLSHSVNYQWFRNGKPLRGETSSQLVLNCLYPDPVTGERKWNYQCQVHNEFDQANSEIAVVELDEANDTTPYIAHQKYAFMVANDTYDHLEHLRKPAADVKDMATLLSSMGFKIFAFRNLTLTEMRNAFTCFCRALVPGSYALFFFAGHGFELYGQTYLQPVDSTDGSLQTESMCSEYILQCMQERKPAMNILLIDACRKLPPNISGDSKSQYPILPGRIFQAKMKNNTIYGYSTSFLCASHESDEETNSVFIKHLKKYITLDKCIQDVLIMVQSDFAKDPIARTIQFPVIKSTLAERRKLKDPVRDLSVPIVQSDVVNWCDIEREIITKSCEISQIKAAIIIEFHHHMEVFCNGMDVYVYLHVNRNADMLILSDMEINLSFMSPILDVVPANGVALKNIDLQLGRHNLLFKKEILNMQKISAENLHCSILLKFCSMNVTQTKDFIADVAKISELQLSVNHLAASNVEDPLLYKNQTTSRNSFT